MFTILISYIIDTEINTIVFKSYNIIRLNKDIEIRKAESILCPIVLKEKIKSDVIHFLTSQINKTQ